MGKISFSLRQLADHLRHLADWWALVNRAETAAELEVVRQAVRRGRPFGREDWREQMVRRFDLGSTLRPRGRPPQRNGS